MSNALQTIGSPKTLSAYLESDAVKEGLVKAAAGKIDTDRVSKIVCRIASDPKNKVLCECSLASLFTALTECVSLGLEPRLGRAYFIPYRDNKNGTVTCQFMLGYQGMLDLARNSGVLATAHAVFEGDEFSFIEGTDERIEHRPNLDNERSAAKFRYAYVVSRIKDGRIFHTIMNKREIDALRDRSKAQNKGPWVTDYVEMAKKTVVRRAAKNWPLSVDAVDAFERDDERTYAGQSFDIMTGVRSGTESVKARLINGDAKPEPQEVYDVEPEEVSSPEQTEEHAKKAADPTPEPGKEAQKQGGDVISEAQSKRLYGIAKSNGYSDEDIKANLASFGFQHSRDVTRKQYETIVKFFEVKNDEPVSNNDGTDCPF